MEKRKLIINEVLVAEYQLEESILYLKTREPLHRDIDAGYNEFTLAKIIEAIEATPIKELAYLNID